MDMLSVVGMLGTATGIQAYSTLRSVMRMREQHEERARDQPETEEGGQATLTLSKRVVVLIPLSASVMLLLFYCIPSLVSLVATLVLLAGAEQGFAFVVTPHSHALLPAVLKRRHPRLAPFAVHAVAVVLLTVWMVNGSVLLNNLFGAALCAMFIALVDVPSMQLATMLLGALFCYDLWWVFGFHAVFGRSGLAAATTATAANPLHFFAAAIGVPLPHRWFVPTLKPLIEFVFSKNTLGLGDVALPGLLLAYLARFDATTHTRPTATATALSASRPHVQYFSLGLCCYTLGLCAAAAAAHAMQQFLPALLFVFPFIVVPPIVLAHLRGELSQLWSPRKTLFGSLTDLAQPITGTPSGGCVYNDKST